MSTENFTQEQISSLRNSIIEHFSFTEVKIMCEDMGVSFDSIPNETKDELVLSLVQYCRRRGKLKELLHYYQEIVNSNLFLPLIKINPSVFVDRQIKNRDSLFVDRLKEKRKILSALQEGKNIITIEGIGGNGKTALATEIVHDLVEGKSIVPYELKNYLYISARNDRLTLEYFLEYVNEKLNAQFADKNLSLKDFEDFTYLLLKKDPCLIFADNMEALKDKRLIKFLLNVPPENIVLITTRHRSIEGVVLNVPNVRNRKKIPLEGLPSQHAIQLSENILYDLNVHSLAHNNSLDELINNSNGNPLTILTMLGLLEDGVHDLRTLATQIKDEVDLLNSIYAKSWSALSNGAKQLLSLMNFFDEFVSREALLGISTLTTKEFAESITQLTRRYLLDFDIKNNSTRYHVHSLTESFVKNRLTVQQTWNKDLYRERWKNWFLDFCVNNTTSDWLSQEITHKNLEHKWKNIIAVFEWCIEHEIEDPRIVNFWLSDSTSEFTKSYGYWKSRLRWLEHIRLKALETETFSHFVKASVELIWTLTRQGGEQQIRRAISLFPLTWKWRNYVDKETLCRLLDTVGVLRTKQRKFSNGQLWFRKALSELSTVDQYAKWVARRKCHIFFYQIDYYKDLGDLNKARSLCEEGITLAKLGDWQRAVYYYRERYAYILLLTSSLLGRVEEMLNSGMNLARKNHDRRSIAFHHRSYAMLEKRKRNIEASLRHAVKAFELFSDLKMESEMQELELFLREIKTNE